MFLGSLRVMHVSKRALADADLPAVLGLVDALFPEALRLDTCQRRIWIYPSFAASLTTAPREVPGTELFSGAEAYSFLLRVATGLESEVKGETDIFGQLKEAWAQFELQGSGLLLALSPWMRKVFEDTKEIRSLHLQNVGTASYGSLVRRVLRSFSESPQGPILLVGSGQIAQSIAPWLLDQELWILNRTRDSAERLKFELLAKEPRARIRVLEADDETQLTAFQMAAHAVICVPVDSERDEARIEAWDQADRASAVPRAVVHLGGMRAACSGWTRLSRFVCLDELFALQKSQNDLRTEQVDRALRACSERARLRGLAGSSAGSATLPHGWEDLAVFADASAG
jgi:hypothetical protein